MADVDEASFKGSLLLMSAVERQLEILGEALNRLRQSDPQTAEQIPDVHRIIAMRNITAHEYGVVDYAIVWSVVTTRLSPLAVALHELLQGT